MADISKITVNNTTYDLKDTNAIHNVDVGVANGVASLDGTGKVPSTQLPIAGGSLPLTGGTMTGNITMDNVDIIFENGNIKYPISVPTTTTEEYTVICEEEEQTLILSEQPITDTLITVSVAVEADGATEYQDVVFTAGTASSIIADPYDLSTATITVEYDGDVEFTITNEQSLVESSYFVQATYTIEVQATTTVEQIAYPIFIQNTWSTLSNQSILPITPCFVMDTSTHIVYWCDGSNIIPANLSATSKRMDNNDLNDQGTGEVWWGNNFINAPNNSTGYFQVYKHGMYQIAYGFQGNTTVPLMYLRSYINSIWQPWIRTDNGDSPEISIGTSAASTAKIWIDTSV